MLVFEEVDYRIHIFNNYMKNSKVKTIEKIIDKTIENYGELLSELTRRKVKFYVYGIPPAAKQENIHNYPYYGSDCERANIYETFNKKNATLLQKAIIISTLIFIHL